jgi:addiction module RelE/StbE family toxin
VKRPLIRSPGFLRDLKRLIKKQPHLDSQLEEVFLQLVEDAFQPSLKTHKLQGELTGMWSCTAGYDLRIIFSMVQHDKEEAILLRTIGTHDEVY